MDFNSLFAPFQNHDLCLWFYFLSVVGFVLLAITIVSTMYIGVTSKKSFTFLLSSLWVLSIYAMFYFQNRLLYTMCVKSIP